MNRASLSWEQYDFEHPVIARDLSRINRHENKVRYQIAQIEHENRQFFFKRALTDETKIKIQNEITWARYINGLHEAGSIGFNSPRIFYSSNNYYVSEWLDAPLLLKPGVKPRGDTVMAIVDVLSELDAVWQRQDTPDFNSGKESDEGRSLGDITLDKLEKLTERTDIDDMLVKDARAAIARANEAPLESGLQHNDFVPWHVFRTDSGPIIFDAEHANNRSPRYYDVAKTFVKVAALYRSQGSRIIELFRQRQGVDHQYFFDSIHRSLLIHVINYLHDTLNDSQPRVHYEAVYSLFQRIVSAKSGDFV